MKIHSAALLLFLCATPSFCKAALVITEVMYDPAGEDYGHEWFEVYNAGTSSAQLSKDKIVEGGAKHNIVAAGNSTVAPNSYAIIAQNVSDFQHDYPNFSGELFHSAISLDNGGAMIGIVDASSSVIAGATYDSSAGAEGDGNSLQRGSDNDTFIARSPSPGASMSASVIPPKTKPISTKGSSSTKGKKSKQEPATSIQTSAPRTNASSSLQVATVEIADNGNSLWWWVGAAALALASAAAFFVAKRYKNHEWNIIEES